MTAARSLSDLPGPRRLPLLGNPRLLRADRIHLTVEEWCRRYGPLVRFHIGSRPNVAIADVDAINAILRDRPEGFRRLREFGAFAEESGVPGLFDQEGDAWRRSRRLVVTALNSNHLQRYFDVIRTAAERLRRRLDALADEGLPFDAGRELTSYSIDVISALAFGHGLNTLERATGSCRSTSKSTCG